MAKKHSQIDDEFTTNEIAGSGETVTPDMNPDGITIDPATTDEQVIVDAPVTDEQPADDDTIVDDTLVNNDNGSESIDPVTDDTVPATDDSVPADVNNGTETPATETNKEEKLNLYKRFNVKFGYSTDSRAITTRRDMSTIEIVNQFVKAPTCFMGLESKKDLEDFKAIVETIEIKVEDKNGKLVDFSKDARKHIAERVTEHTLRVIK